MKVLDFDPWNATQTPFQIAQTKLMKSTDSYDKVWDIVGAGMRFACMHPGDGDADASDYAFVEVPVPAIIVFERVP